MAHPAPELDPGEDRDVPWYIFVLWALLLVGFIAWTTQVLERRAQLDCEERGGTVIEINNGWVCAPPLESE